MAFLANLYPLRQLLYGYPILLYGVMLSMHCLCMSFEVGGNRRKPEYPEETHANTGRTCKLHTERPGLGRKRTQDLLAVRQQR